MTAAAFLWWVAAATAQDGSTAPAAPAEPADGWNVRPLMDGRWRPGDHLLLRVRIPESATAGREPAFRIGVRPVADPAADPPPVEYAAPVGVVRNTPGAVVPVILHRPVSSVQVTVYGEKDRVLETAEVPLTGPALRELRPRERLVVMLTANPAALTAEMARAGLALPAGWGEPVWVAPSDVPANFAGLEAADLLLVDYAGYSVRSQPLAMLENWARRHADPEVAEVFGGSVVIYDRSDPPAGEGRPDWGRPGRAGEAAPAPGAPAVPFRAYRGAGFPRGAFPMGIQDDPAASAVGATLSDRPRIADDDRRALLVAALGVVAAVGLCGLFFGRPGRFGLAVAGLAVVCVSLAAVAAWVLPQRPSVRLDVLEVFEVRPAGPGVTDPAPYRRVLCLTAAALRESPFRVATAAPEALEPAFPGNADRGFAPLRIETREDSTELTLNPAVRRYRADEADPRLGATAVRWAAAMPIYGAFARGSGAERTAVTLSRTAARTITLRTGDMWAWKLTDAVVIDIKDPVLSGRPSLARHLEKAALTEREQTLLTLSEARVVPVGNVDRSGMEVSVELLGGRAATLADHTRPAPGDVARTRRRKAALRAFADGDGRVRPAGPYLVGWMEPPRPALAPVPPRVTVEDLGWLVFIRLDAAWAGGSPPPGGF
jgi:hypothetical protein